MHNLCILNMAGMDCGIVGRLWNRLKASLHVVVIDTLDLLCSLGMS